MAEFPEYELAGIEVIARGIAIEGGKVLLCQAKGGSSTYLPGGHIEFGELGRDALRREVKEELGLEADVGRFITAVENIFTQHGKPHQEVNLVFEMTIPEGSEIKSMEDWISFKWCDISDIDSANLLPARMTELVKSMSFDRKTA